MTKKPTPIITTTKKPVLAVKSTIKSGPEIIVRPR